MQKTIIQNYNINDIVKIIGDKPQLDADLHIHLSKEKFANIPLQFPFRGGNYAFLLVIKGTLTIQLDLIEYKVSSNEMITVKPQTVIQFIKMSTDVEVASISFTIDFILKNDFKKSEFDALDFFTAKSIPKLKLSLEESNHTVMLLKLIEKKNTKEVKGIIFRNEIIRHAFGLLLYQLGWLYKKEYPNLEADLTRQKQLTIRFFKILNTNFKNERSVQFYADQLCLTAGYLSKTLKEVTGKTASQLIDDTVIMEAKLLLKDSLRSVTEVAEDLKFSNASFFGKFFKKHTGFSPTEFRKNTKI